MDVQADPTDYTDPLNWDRQGLPGSQDAAIIAANCVLKPGSPSQTVSALTVNSGATFTVGSDLSVVQSRFFSGNTAVFGTLTIAGLNNGVTANLSTASANAGGGSGNTSGGTTIEPQADFTAAGADPKFMSAGTITNNNMLTDLGGTGPLEIASGAIFDMAFGKVQVSLPAIEGYAGTLGLFDNLGGATLEFDAPASTPTVITCNFSNGSYLDVDAGDAAELDAKMMGGRPPTINLDGNLSLEGDLTLLGTVSAPSGLVVGAGGGTLKIGEGMPLMSGTLSLPEGMTIGSDGNVEVLDYSFLTGAGQLTNSGTLTLDIGSSTSGLGSYQETSTGTLDVQASGPAAYSALAVAGLAQLSGTLKIDFVGGYNPTKGTIFTVLSAGSIGAHFDTTPSGMTVTYGANSVTLTQN